MEDNLDNHDVTPSRELTLEILQKLDKWRGFADEVVSSTLRKHFLDPRDKHLITELVQGCLRHRIQLDYIIRNVSHSPLNKIDPVILNILRMGVYQLLFTDRIPPSAAVNESVKLARFRGQVNAVAFVNALLRKIAQEGHEILNKPLKDPVYDIALKTSHPEWLVRRWVDRFGEEKAKILLHSNNEIPSMTIRVNTLKISKQEVKQKLESDGLGVSDGLIVPEALSISGRTLPPEHELLVDGLIHIQDESSQLVSMILNPAPGDLVLDMCAAPGTKTTHLAAIMNNTGSIVAWDLNPLRVRDLKENCTRMGAAIVNVEQHDATQYDPRCTDRFDEVLVDAPCSALGIIRRHPEIKWSRHDNDFSKLVLVQMKLLANACKYLKKDGKLLYSVCSTEPEEGEQVIETLLKQHPYMQLVHPISRNPAAMKNLEIHKGWIRTFPPYWDGFFIAKLAKIRYK